MILTCPACSTRYQADEANFAPSGRNVRCAKCGQTWYQPAPEQDAEPTVFIGEPEPAAPPPGEYEPAPRPQAFMQTPSFNAPRQQEEAPRHRSPWPRRIVLGMGWICLVAVVVVIGWGAAVYRQQIVTSWPQSASLYTKLGVVTNASGLQFEDVKYREDTQDGQPVLAVSGKLVNVTNHEVPVPQIRVALTDNDKRELYHWTFMPEVMSLRPGQSTRFVTRLTSPPLAARHLDLRFAKAGE